jgi:hypothetical protein
VLEHTGAGPLELYIAWPVTEGTLELIAYGKHPISSLSIRNTKDVKIDWQRFKNFNLDSLQYMRPNNLIEDYDIEHFLDLPLESTCKGITLGLIDNTDTSSYGFFDHPLLQRVERVIFHIRECFSHIFSCSLYYFQSCGYGGFLR